MDAPNVPPSMYTFSQLREIDHVTSLEEVVIDKDFMDEITGTNVDYHSR